MRIGLNNKEIPEEAIQSLKIIKELLDSDSILVGVYLYGSAVMEGLRINSDIDILVVINHSLSERTRRELTDRLMLISGKIGNPLTCEALYGVINYDCYSYEKEMDSTLFLTRSNYRQDSLPAKDAPPRLEFDILEPQFKFVYHLAKNHLLERENESFEPIDNKIFGTVEAYQGIMIIRQ